MLKTETAFQELLKSITELIWNDLVVLAGLCLESVVTADVQVAELAGIVLVERLYYRSQVVV